MINCDNSNCIFCNDFHNCIKEEVTILDKQCASFMAGSYHDMIELTRQQILDLYSMIVKLGTSKMSESELGTYSVFTDIAKRKLDL